MSTTEQPARTLLTTREVAAQLGVGRSTVYRWITAGQLPAIRIGSGRCAPIRVPVDELHATLHRTRDAA
ncbi:MAG TPA: helix-turn-helix domain-containing protein [Solirubrobacteraceae bacterium]|nr:helix-turn-helix domain-containing protein [Solirubrobacteraceae bacterium]